MTQRPSLSEWEIISQFVSRKRHQLPNLIMWPGDDCALMKGSAGEDWLITSDALFEEIHFKRSFTDLETLGAKSLAVNLSDIAAMGGEPRFYTVSLGLPRETAAQDAAKLRQGLENMEARFGAQLIGGDTCRSMSGLVISITLIGVLPSGTALLRSGARSGDALYVTGPLGNSALGLHCLQQGMHGEDAAPFIEAHRLPEPKLVVGQWLREWGGVTSMIDVSDGLFSDLSHIADASRMGFEIEVDRIPTVSHFEALARKLGLDPHHLMLSGGEDYELLFTVSSRDAARFEKVLATQAHSFLSSVRRIGKIVSDESVRLIRDGHGSSIALVQGGFDHFSK